MSSNDKNFWMPKESGCLTDGKMGIGTSSKVEQKRHCQWDAPEEEHVYIKKQAAESIDNRPIPGSANVNISLWGNSSSCQSASSQFNDPIFGPPRTSDLARKNVSSNGSGNLNMERKGLLDQFVHDPAVNLSMYQMMEEPMCPHGAGKANVNQIRNPTNAFSMSMGQPYTIGGNNEVAICSTYQGISDNTVAFRPTYTKEDGNDISLGPTFSKAGNNFISMGQTLSKEGPEFRLMGHHYNRPNDSMLSMVQPFNKGISSFITLDQQYGTGNSNFLSTGPAYDKEHENFIMMGPPYGKATENFKSVDPTFDKSHAVIASIGPTHCKENATSMSTDILSMGQIYNDGEGTVISFGPEANDSSGETFNNSHVLTLQSSAPANEATVQKDSAEPIVNQVKNVTSARKTDGVPKNKEQKKISNTFPANVKSMLSTGIFDGVPVKYVSWSREKNLRGVIRGSGYLCGCDDCKHSKVVNAYEFERHADCKTKHPNNHIYFENGKTVYAAVQELKSTPQEMLFQAIQNVTGSPINQKNFRTWKVSYQAATIELERIYGKDEVVVAA